MPMTPKGSKIMSAMMKQYGAKKGESVFYASKNKGTIKGVEGHSGAKKSIAVMNAIGRRLASKKKKK